MKTPIIIGASGLVGGYLFEHFKKQDSATIGTFGQCAKADMVQFSLHTSRMSDLPLQADKSYVAIICAAVTNIKYINDNPDEAEAINVTATVKLMQEFHNAGIPVIYVSSDNVFRGDTGVYRDNSPRHPVSEYGVQKAKAEDQLLALTQGNCTIIRLAKVVGNATDSTSILFDIYKQLNSGDLVRAATDLIFNPTYIGDTVAMFESLLKQQQIGVFNFCNTEVYNRYDLSVLVANALQMPKPNLKAISFLEIDSSGKRPLNTTMINSSIFEDFQFTTIAGCIERFKQYWP